MSQKRLWACALFFFFMFLQQSFAFDCSDLLIRQIEISLASRAKTPSPAAELTQGETKALLQSRAGHLRNTLENWILIQNYFDEQVRNAETRNKDGRLVFNPTPEIALYHRALREAYIDLMERAFYLVQFRNDSISEVKPELVNLASAANLNRLKAVWEAVPFYSGPGETEQANEALREAEREIRVLRELLIDSPEGSSERVKALSISILRHVTAADRLHSDVEALPDRLVEEEPAPDEIFSGEPLSSAELSHRFKELRSSVDQLLRQTYAMINRKDFSLGPVPGILAQDKISKLQLRCKNLDLLLSAKLKNAKAFEKEAGDDVSLIETLMDIRSSVGLIRIHLEKAQARLAKAQSR